MSSPIPNAWSDRRAMFQKGKEVHEPGKPVNRRPSGAGSALAETIRRSSTSSSDGLEKTASNASGGGGQRRTSNTAMYGNLMQHKRGSEDYGERRASHSEQMNGGVFSGWYNSTFRGMQGAKAPAEAMQQEKK